MGGKPEKTLFFSWLPLSLAHGLTSGLVTGKHKCVHVPGMCTPHPVPGAPSLGALQFPGGRMEMVNSELCAKTAYGLLPSPHLPTPPP